MRLYWRKTLLEGNDWRGARFLTAEAGDTYCYLVLAVWDHRKEWAVYWTSKPECPCTQRQHRRLAHGQKDTAKAAEQRGLERLELEIEKFRADGYE